MTPAERAVIDAAKALVANLDDVDATRNLIDAVTVLDAEPATFTDADGVVWHKRANGRYSVGYSDGIQTLDVIRHQYGEQR